MLDDTRLSNLLHYVNSLESRANKRTGAAYAPTEVAALRRTLHAGAPLLAYRQALVEG
jgi:hypothetical protein